MLVDSGWTSTSSLGTRTSGLPSRCVSRYFSLPVKVLHYSDGMRGGTLGLMYNLLLQLDDLYSSPIEGLPDKVRTKVSPRCIV